MGHRAKAGDERARERNLIGCLLGRCFEAERDRERPALRLGELFGDVRQSTIQHVAEPTERERHLDLGAPRREHPDTGLLCGLQPGAPEHRLPDPGLAANERAPGALGETGDELPQLGELVLPPDELEPARDNHSLIVLQPNLRFQVEAGRSVGFPRMRTPPPAPTLERLMTPQRRYGCPV